jgi:hypothetical protein
MVHSHKLQTSAFSKELSDSSDGEEIDSSEKTDCTSKNSNIQSEHSCDSGYCSNSDSTENNTYANSLLLQNSTANTEKDTPANSLPLQNLTANTENTENPNQDNTQDYSECAICLSPFVSPYLKHECSLCSGTFHRACLRRWFRTQPSRRTCPNCRHGESAVSPSSTVTYEDTNDYENFNTESITDPSILSSEFLQMVIAIGWTILFTLIYQPDLDAAISALGAHPVFFVWVTTYVIPFFMDVLGDYLTDLGHGLLVYSLIAILLTSFTWLGACDIPAKLTMIAGTLATVVICFNGFNGF